MILHAHLLLVRGLGVSSVQATKDPRDMPPAELTTTVKRLDADLFGAYNDCELEKFGSFFPENLELP